MARIKRIDHVAIVVEDIDLGVKFWSGTLGLDLGYVEEVAEQKAVVAFLPLAGSEVELVRPTTQDSGVSRFLQKRGPGMHHICFEVEGLDALLVDLKEKGVRLINETPVPGASGSRIAFIHPESTQGVLVELYELGAPGSED